MDDDNTPRPEPTAQAVAQWATDLRLEDVPADVTARTTDLLLDTLGVGIGAGRSPAAAIAYDLAAAAFAAGGAAGARLPFDGRCVSAAGAAYAFATRIDNLDAHDGYQPGKGHAGVALVPTLLAVAEAHRPDVRGAAALAALVAGYEVACRAGAALHATAADYHSSGAWNALGAATVAARLRGLSADTAAAALGIAEYHAPRASMMREIDAPSMLHDSSGWGALAGVTGTDLAHRGFAASPSALVAAGGDWSGLGREWRVVEQYVKPHPVCFWAQPAVTAALRLRAAHGVDPADIRRVRVDTFHEATRLHAGVPTDTHTAQYALAFPVAAALARGRLGPEEVAADGLADAAAGELTARIEVQERAAFSRRFPDRRLAAVTLELADGTALASGPTEPRGTPADPMGRDAIRDKFADYAAPVVGAERAAALERCVYALADGSGEAAALLELTGRT